ncbi:MAG: hypothetical protein OXC72_02460 [Roseovarius sp.]|nr:hypothetical protein [Roseovarius sp.]MCY4290608.1 hypothetical protein [Roseovarius sp.]
MALKRVFVDTGWHGHKQTGATLARKSVRPRDHPGASSQQVGKRLKPARKRN